jgi:hypothetical protein
LTRGKNLGYFLGRMFNTTTFGWKNCLLLSIRYCWARFFTVQWYLGRRGISQLRGIWLTLALFISNLLRKYSVGLHLHLIVRQNYDPLLSFSCI